MGPEEFYDPLVRALLYPPETSLAALSKVLRGEQPPPLGRAAGVVQSAMGYSALILREAYWPPKEVVVAFKNEAGQFDVLRAAWITADGSEMMMAQSKYVIIVSAHGMMPADAPVDLVTVGAQKLLNVDADLQMADWGRADRERFGGRDDSDGGFADEDWPHWRDGLMWSLNDRALSFITIKAGGGPTREVLSLGVEDNRGWF